MTVPASKVASVRTYLLNGITTAVDDAEVGIAYDAIGPQLPDDIILVGRVARDMVMHAMVGGLGTHAMVEDFTVSVVVSVYRGGDHAETVQDRAVALCDIVEAFVRGDPTLGGRVQLAYPDTSQLEGFFAENHTGRAVEIELLIRCKAES